MNETMILADEPAHRKAEPLVKQSTELVVQANQVGEIATGDQYRDAVNLGKALRSMNKGIEEFWEPLKSAAYKSWKELVAREKSMLEPVQSAIRTVDAGIGGYLQRQEQERLQREREARESALKAEQERLLAEAAHLSETGQHQEAEQVLNEAVTVEAPPVILPSSVPKVAGASQRSEWKFEITDEKLIPREYLVPDLVRIGQVVRAMKNHAKIPGIKVYEKKGLAMRS